MKKIYKSFIKANVLAETNDEVIKLLSDVLYEAGMVKESFADGVLAREKLHPTGLPTVPICIAIPHTEKEHVIKPAVAVAQLAKPVLFKTMEETGDDLPVEIVFLLATNDSDDHLKFIKSLMKVFHDGEELVKLKEAKSIEEIYDILSFLNN